MPVAIAAVDIAFFINLEPHARMTQRGWDNSAAITGYTRFTYSDGFRIIFVHEGRLAKQSLPCNGSER